MGKLLQALLTTATFPASASAFAQEAANVGHGRQIAYTICIACHAVARDQQVSPNSEAPQFPLIAATPGMTSIALTAALRASYDVGSFGVITHPIDDQIRQFYRRWGFEDMPFDPRRSMIVRMVDLEKSGVVA